MLLFFVFERMFTYSSQGFFFFLFFRLFWYNTVWIKVFSYFFCFLKLNLFCFSSFKMKAIKRIVGIFFFLSFVKTCSDLFEKLVRTRFSMLTCLFDGFILFEQLFQGFGKIVFDMFCQISEDKVMLESFSFNQGCKTPSEKKMVFNFNTFFSPTKSREGKVERIDR